MFNTDYALLHYPRNTEADPSVATVIYSINGEDWFPMVTGDTEWASEAMEALCYREYDRRKEASEEAARIKAEIEEAQGEWECYG